MRVWVGRILLLAAFVFLLWVFVIDREDSETGDATLPEELKGTEETQEGSDYFDFFEAEEEYGLEESEEEEGALDEAEAEAEEAEEVEETRETRQIRDADIVRPEKAALPGAVIVMCDNFSKARPQSGLDKADIVYEIIAEGGITRFMALFYTQAAEEIGPIRSARDYFVKLACGYDAPLAHAGGSARTLHTIASLGVNTLDEIYNAGPYFWRDKGRRMPHNLYTSTDLLLKGAAKKGYEVKPPELPPVGRAWDGEEFTGQITIDYSLAKDYLYKVGWAYDKGTDKYLRLINGEPHKVKSGASITADNVIVLLVNTESYKENRETYSDVQIVGEGGALYYINGKRMIGYWVKEDVDAPMYFLDEEGDLMKLKAGNIWVQVIPSLKSLHEDENSINSRLLERERAGAETQGRPEPQGAPEDEDWFEGLEGFEGEEGNIPGGPADEGSGEGREYKYQGPKWGQGNRLEEDEAGTEGEGRRRGPDEGRGEGEDRGRRPEGGGNEDGMGPPGERRDGRPGGAGGRPGRPFNPKDNEPPKVLK